MKSVKGRTNPACDIPAAPPKEKQLEAKYLLKIALDYDRRPQPRHHLVFGFLLEWYVDKDHKDALASVRWIAELLEERARQYPYGRGLGRSQVQATLADLVAWNYVLRTEVGVRGTGSRWVPNWALVWLPESGFVRTSPDALFVRTSPDTVVRTSPDVNGEYVRTVPDKDPFTDPVTNRGQLNGNHSSPAAASPPPGLSASAEAGTGAARVPEARTGFDEFWLAFPKKVKRARARAEYERISPGAELHALIVSKAAELAAHHDEHQTEFRWIKEPTNWLAGEGWLEDLPAVYDKPKAIPPAPKPAPAKPKPPAPANSNAPAAERQWRQLTIDGATVDRSAKGSVLVLRLLADDGTTITEKIICEDASEDIQAIGQKQLACLRMAVGIDDLDDERDLVGLSFMRRVIGGKVEYRAIAAAAA